MIIVLMGVSGCGKTSIGKALSQKLHNKFIDADDFHSDENKAKMASGIPLTDDDRWDWLQRIRQRMLTLKDLDCIVACSSLKRAYRDFLSGRNEDTSNILDIVFIHLSGNMDTIHRRMKVRKNHFMPEFLLRSQFDTLEALEMSEKGFQISIEHPIEHILEDIVNNLRIYKSNNK